MSSGWRLRPGREKEGETVDLVIRNGRLATPQGVVEGGLVIDGGTITAIMRNADLPRADREIDADGRLVLPGAIDSHCHLGQTDKSLAHLPEHTVAGNFVSESRSATFGGTTSVCNYALFSQESLLKVLPPERQAVEAGSLVDVWFHGYLMNELHLSEYERYVRELGLKTFKIFMPYRGQEALDLGGLSSLNDAQMVRAFRMIARTPGAMAMMHAEDGDIIDALTPELRKTGRQDLAAWDESRPDYSEADAILRAVYLARKADCPVCIVHISSGDGVEAVTDLHHPKAVVESCITYLALDTSMDLGPLGKVCPPLRSRANVDRLWEAAERGVIRFVGSDHNNWTRALKQEMWTGLAGLPGVNLVLPVTYTEAVSKRGMSIERVVELTSAGAARAMGLWPRKGAIQVGSDADLVVLETGSRRTIRAAELGSCVDYTPFEGYEAQAWPHATVVRGQVVWEGGRRSDVAPGKVLNRPMEVNG